MFLLGEDARNYELMRLVNMELAFNVDVSKLGCGMNGALYLSEMDVSGSRSDLNPAGAAYGTGECDAQCFQNQNFTVRIMCLLNDKYPWSICQRFSLTWRLSQEWCGEPRIPSPRGMLQRVGHLGGMSAQGKCNSPSSLSPSTNRQPLTWSLLPGQPRGNGIDTTHVQQTLFF